MPTLIDLIRGHDSAVAWFANLPETPSVSGIAAMELVVGCRDQRELRSVQSFLQQFSLAWPTAADLQTAYGTFLPTRLSTGIGLLDSLIAATAYGRGEPVATFNVKHFAGLTGVTTVQPYVRAL